MQSETASRSEALVAAFIRSPDFLTAFARRAAVQPDRVCLTHLEDGERSERSWTYGELDRRARILAGELRRRCRPGDRVLLVYPTGLEFIAAFIACLYADLIAVPAYPPRPRRMLQDANFTRLRDILASAAPRAGLLERQILDRMRKQAGDLKDVAAVEWIASDELSGQGAAGRDASDPADFAAFRDAPADPARLARPAFLQFTSGSTGAARGVIITHGALGQNLELMRRQLDPRESYRLVSWLPLYHDMGLIACALLPLTFGFPATLFSSALFLQRPLRWMEALSRIGGTHTSAPSFAYALVASALEKAEELAEQDEGAPLPQLDLSRMISAFNGAEPVRGDVIERFERAFGRYGLPPGTVRPGYGLAETCVGVCWTPQGRPAVRLQLDADRLANGEFQPVDALGASSPSNNASDASGADNAKDAPGGIIELVACGAIDPVQKLRIVAPETLAILPEGRVGEIWIQSPSAAAGYWNQPEESDATFRAELPGEAGSWLRTGDLGALYQEELYIAGRLKDVIILNGRNYYPADFERTAEEAHPLLQAAGGAAFAVSGEDGREQLVLVHEAARRFRPGLDDAPVLEALRQAIYDAYGIPVHAAALLRIFTLPKTTSGKVRRLAARRMYLDGELEVLAHWESGRGCRTSASSDASPAAQPAGS